MSKSFPVLLVGSIASILLSSVTFAQAPSVPTPSVQSADAKVPNVEGNWKMSIVGENLAPTYTLIQKGTALTGTFKGPMGELPLTGSVTSDRKVAFAVKFRGASLKFAGTVEGETMKGVADLPTGQKNWTATK
ncbi:MULTISPECIES: hypothetical protein [unclassified Microcoleus]|uniref:hypothetical protein n=1 Tax=unclassified Microcoleus TaxID=2642155 RepID=UPI0025E4B2CA|nr:MULTISPECIES: hypothetical protein [unclassified Microcoleus]